MAATALGPTEGDKPEIIPRQVPTVTTQAVQEDEIDNDEKVEVWSLDVAMVLKKPALICEDLRN